MFYYWGQQIKVGRHAARNLGGKVDEEKKNAMFGEKKGTKLWILWPRRFKEMRKKIFSPHKLMAKLICLERLYASCFTWEKKWKKFKLFTIKQHNYTFESESFFNNNDCKSICFRFFHNQSKGQPVDDDTYH